MPQTRRHVALGDRGYPVTNGGNADKFNYFKTKILYDPSVAGAEAAATQMADLFGDGEAEAVQPGQQLETMLQVIVGQTFHGDLTPGPADNTPTHEPPAITHGVDRCRRAEERQKEGGLPALHADRARGELVALHARAGA